LARNRAAQKAAAVADDKLEPEEAVAEDDPPAPTSDFEYPDRVEPEAEDDEDATTESKLVTTLNRRMRRRTKKRRLRQNQLERKRTSQGW